MAALPHRDVRAGRSKNYRKRFFGQDGARITEKDLREIVETFTPTRPITIGHDAAHGDNFPKFGDVLLIDGIYDDARHKGEKVLVGQVVLHPELEKQFSDKDDGDGCYKGWSVTIPKRGSDGKRYLHSLAICGATPPKIPGLEQLMTKSCYSDGDCVEVFDFSDSINYQEEIPMTDEEKKKMEALEAENKKLKEDAEKKAAEKPNEEKKEKFSDSPEFADMQKEIAELKAGKKLSSRACATSSPTSRQDLRTAFRRSPPCSPQTQSRSSSRTRTETRARNQPLICSETFSQGFRQPRKRVM